MYPEHGHQKKKPENVNSPGVRFQALTDMSFMEHSMKKILKN